ncbi:hypothetical protein EGW08_020794 [Elysia chlorotica]|uniref:Disintegrin domain-containing protein n=1 Tax=Elysia chlorotica TaxID=188477 RepID=A0A3S1AZX2_ELYCH|nr:hypothetical protein EGW08_020794 [Elysia chlorotica]
MLCGCLVILASVACWRCLSSARENIHFSYYETLSTISVTTRAKRSNAYSSTLEKELHFKAFRRSFHLSLRSGLPVLARGFRARMVHGDGSSTWFTMDQSKLFTGHVVHSPWSVVGAYLEGNLWNIHILEVGEAYAVEPAWRLLERPDNPGNDTMVAYRLSDLKGFQSNNSFCSPSLRLNRSTSENLRERRRHWHSGESRLVHERRTRDAKLKDTCLLNVVIDTHMFNGRCGRDHNTCSSLVAMLVQITDERYRGFKFESAVGVYHTNIGIQMGRLALITDFEPSGASFTRHFNEDFDFLGPQKLEAFSREIAKSRDKYCLNHLFSEFRDPDGVLGRGYINVLCDYQEIGRNIPARCFKPRSEIFGFCGNGIIDKGEQCDPGVVSKEDKCCTSKCLFREFANCSETNEECCSDCQIAPKGTVCRVPGYIHSCIQQSRCTGTHASCPQGPIFPDGKECGPQHMCSNGKCIGPCEIASQISRDRLFRSCSCTNNASQMCSYCCFDATDPTYPGECQVFVQSSKPDGSRCYFGICKGGYCERPITYSSLRIGQYLEFVHRSTLRELLRRNIVIVVVFLGLVLWLPPSLFLIHVDNVQREEMRLLTSEDTFDAQLKELRMRHSVKCKSLTPSPSSSSASEADCIVLDRKLSSSVDDTFILKLKVSQKSSDHERVVRFSESTT